MGQSLHFAQLFKVLEPPDFPGQRRVIYSIWSSTHQNPDYREVGERFNPQGNASLLKTVLGRRDHMAGTRSLRAIHPPQC